MFCEQGVQVSQPLKLVRQKEQREDSGIAKRETEEHEVRRPCSSRIKLHGIGWKNNEKTKLTMEPSPKPKELQPIGFQLIKLEVLKSFKTLDISTDLGPAVSSGLI